MTGKLVYEASVDYTDVDRSERLLLSSYVGLFQEAAIKHASRFDTGVGSASERGESWILNRLAARLDHYPAYGDNLRIETWSTGIIGFRGFREYRVYSNSKLTASATSLWVYFNVEKKALTKVPQDILDTFPRVDEGPYFQRIERSSTPMPDVGAPGVPITLRYGDVDANAHVNNTVYFDFLQTALALKGRSPRPAELFIRFLKEVPPETSEVTVRIDSSSTHCLFSIGTDRNVCALGSVA